MACPAHRSEKYTSSSPELDIQKKATQCHTQTLHPLAVVVFALAPRSELPPLPGDSPPQWLRERLLDGLAQRDAQAHGELQPQPPQLPLVAPASVEDGGSGSSAGFPQLQVTAGTSGDSTTPTTPVLMGPPAR